jgi:hypothetical protein
MVTADPWYNQDMDDAHAYLIGDLLLMPIWLALYLYRKDLRGQMLNMSFLGAVLSVLFAPAFLHDYWHPIYTFSLPGWPLGRMEDLLNGFLVIGIASVIYEELFAKKLTANRSHRKNYLRWAPLSLVIYVLLFLVPVYIGLWSLYAALLSFAAVLVFIFCLRHDLIKDSILSGLLLGMVATVGYLLFLRLYPDSIRFWYRDNLNQHLLLGIPTGEFLWAFFLGATSGPLYEFFSGKKLTARSKHR